MDCIFCKIVKGEIPADKLYEDDEIIAFRDLSPQAPTHFLVIPKEHITSAQEITVDNSEIISKIFEEIPKLAKEEGIDEKGFRIVNNIGKQGGQSVDHIHFHILGGRDLQWPPG